MAEKALQKVEDQLSCSVCLETYTDPRLLPCFHVFCQKCLAKLVEKSQQGLLSLSCPICRQVMPLPANGVPGLNQAFHINHFLEIAQELKRATSELSAGTSTLKGSMGSSSEANTTQFFCPEHDAKGVELYCNTCGKLICSKCALKGGHHQSHDYQELDKAFERFKVEVTALLKPMENEVATISRSLAELDARSGEISNQQKIIETDLHSTFTQLHDVLYARESELIAQLQKMTQFKMKTLATQRDRIETTLAQLNSCLSFMRESLQSESQEQVLTMKQGVMKQVNELTTSLPTYMLKPNIEADVTYTAPTDLTALCQNFGDLRSPSSPDPSKCHATGKGLNVAEVGEMSIAALHSVDLMDRPCKVPLSSVECELVSEITATRIRGSIIRKADYQYEISYRPTIKGRHLLHIKVESQHIRGSPFSIAAKAPVTKLGIPILLIGEVKKPRDVAITRGGEVVVSEYEASCVSVFASSGEKLWSFGMEGSGKGEFKNPCGITLDGAGNILVADMKNHRIQKFTIDGQFLTAVGTEGSGPLQFSYPWGIAFNATNGKVYVTDSNHHIQVLGSDLSFSGMISKRSGSKGLFDTLYGIACDSTGRIFVTDYCNHAVQVFTADGTHLKTFRKCGSDRKELYSPMAVTVDPNDRVYVSEHGNHRISVFSSEGEFITSFGSYGEQPGQFRAPRGICVDNSGVVYVCDRGNYRVQLF